MSEHKRLLRTFIIENFLFGDNEELKDNTSFLEEGVIDSTGILELVSFIEETFEISIEDEELIPENLDSIDNIDRYLREKQGV